MGTKKAETSLISSIESQEEWDRLMKFNGLLVVDLYQEWNGPCRSVISLFTKLSAEINDERINFAQVKVDNIRSLHMYRGKSEPTFLFMGGGQLVGCVRGPNAPIIKELCILKFSEELKVLKGEMERIVIRDPGLTRVESVEDTKFENTYYFKEEEMTFVILKPNILSSGAINRVLKKIKEERFEINKKEIRQLSAEELSSLYSKQLKLDHSETMTSYLGHGKCCLLALTSDIYNPVVRFREIIGPEDVEYAKSTQPESLRAIFGTAAYRNGIHCAETREEALKAINTVFPELLYTKDDPIDDDLERTIFMIPERIYADEKKSILNQLEKAEISVYQQTETSISKYDINYLYKDIVTKRDIMEDRIEELHGSIFLILCLEGKNCINLINMMLGLLESEDDVDYKKLTIREYDTPELIYASSNKSNAIRDENFFFPIEQTFAIVKPDAYEQRDEIMKLIKTGGYSIPIADDIYLSYHEAHEIYRNIRDLPHFSPVIANMTSGPSLVMALSKYDAVLQWRDFIGCVNPEEAAEQSPDKLRGIFGSTIIQNALHSASTSNSAFQCINMLFGNVQFDDRGNVSIQKPLNTEANFPITVYRPESVDESKMQDVIKKFQTDKKMDCERIEKQCSYKELANLFASIKNPDSCPNLKCFIEIAFNIIPVFFHEESESFIKVEHINNFSHGQKNNRLRFDLWLSKFETKQVEPELSYVIYKFTDSR